MISTTTIDTINELNILDVIGRYTTLKPKGKEHEGISPFTDEKTPSFKVNPSKNLWKCFSTGLGGVGGVSFVMQKCSLSWLEALKQIANDHSITIEYEAETEAQKEKRISAATLYKMNLAANRKFVKERLAVNENHFPLAYDQLQRYAAETIDQWQIGYTSGNLITPAAIENGVARDCEKAGLIVEKGDRHRDFFFDRVIFPIHNERGDIVGFGGRALADAKPKYLNTGDTPIFNKSKTLYGLYHAIDGIRKNGRCIITEGYADTLAMHEASFTETVATLGTALTDEHCKMLKRYTQTAVILRDGDKAGLKAAEKDVKLLVKHGFKAEIVELPEGTDPYDLTHSMEIEDPVAWINEHCEDGVLWLVNRLYDNTDPYKKAISIEAIGGLLAEITDPIVSDHYRGTIAKKLKIKVADLKRKETEQAELKIEVNQAVPRLKLPDGVSAEDALQDGFYGVVNGEATGYYFREGEKSFIKLTNFVITPLFHKYDHDDNTRVIKIENGISESEIIEMPSRALISVDQFRTFLFDKGAYFWSGAKQHLDKLNQKYLFEFPKAYELKTLGWQHEGFFAFFNCVYNGKLSQYDNAGLVEHGGRKFFSPAVSDIYKDLRKEDDLFENDRYLSYKPSPINFEQWAALMVQVYQDHAWAGIPYVLVSLFRDIVFKVDNNCPHFYCYGQTQSGKSKFGESLMAVFFDEMPAFNLNTGTDYAFANRLARFKNCPVAFNEFDESVVKDEWFQSIKGAYDGEGRERGKGKRNKTEIQRVNSALILMGQYLVTKDDNSVVNRSIIRSFKQQKDRDQTVIDAFNKLKQYEKGGITSLVTELLPHRDELDKKYYQTFSDTFKILRGYMAKHKHEFEERVLRNYCAMATMVKFFAPKIKLPFSVDDYLQWCIREVIDISNMISESDILTDFWVTVQTLFDSVPQQVIEGVHFKVETKESIRISGEDKKDFEKQLPYAKEVLYIRLTEVQKAYAMQVRREGKTPINATSLSSYLRNRDYYLGYVNSEKIGGRAVSCFVFDYELLNINLEKPESRRNTDYPPPPDYAQAPGYKGGDNEDDLPF